MKTFALGIALASLALGQEDDFEFDIDDELDALIEGELIDEGGPSEGPFRGIQGFVAFEPRTYFEDRGGARNDEQFLLHGELELDLRFGQDWTGYLRPRFLLDLTDGDYDRFEPFEAYTTLEGTGWDLRAGSFVENWGIVDTYNPLDVLNRRDFGSDLLDADRLGEVGLRFRRTFEGGETFGEPTLSLYAMPVWQRTPFAPEDQRFAISSGPLLFNESAGFEPDGSERLFFGLRGQTTLSTAPLNGDVQVIAARGPGRFPSLTVSGGELVPVYHESTVMGAGIRAVPNEDSLGSELAKYTLKLEWASTINDALDGAPIAAPEDYTSWVLGVDRVFDGVFATQDSLTTTVEYAKETGASDAQASNRPFQNDLVLRGLWEAGDFDRTSIEARGVFDLDHNEWIGELIYEQQLRSWHEDLKLKIQLQVFEPGSPTESLFGLFPNNSSLMVGLRWGF